MTKNKISKHYDLEDRTLQFAKDTKAFVKKLPKTLANFEDGKQSDLYLPPKHEIKFQVLKHELL